MPLQHMFNLALLETFLAPKDGINSKTVLERQNREKNENRSNRTYDYKLLMERKGWLNSVVSSSAGSICNG